MMRRDEIIERLVLVVLMIVAFSSLGLIVTGCGGGEADKIKAVTEVNTTDVNQTIVVPVPDVNITIDDNETIIINDDENITVIINYEDTGAYGDGSMLHPYLMANANYKVPEGEVWMITPSINSNCTIRVRTKVYITNIIAEGNDLLPRPIRHLTNNVFEFDLNDTRWATLNFVAWEAGYITVVGECLDEPKLYDFDFGGSL